MRSKFFDFVEAFQSPWIRFARRKALVHPSGGGKFQSPWIRFARAIFNYPREGGTSLFQSPWIRFALRKTFESSDNCVSFQSPWIRFALILKGDALEDVREALFQSPWIRFAQCGRGRKSPND